MPVSPRPSLGADPRRDCPDDDALVARLTEAVMRRIGGAGICSEAEAERAVGALVRTRAAADGRVRLSEAHADSNIPVEQLRAVFYALLLSFEGVAKFYPTCPSCEAVWGPETDAADESEGVRPAGEVCGHCEKSVEGQKTRVVIALYLPPRSEGS